MTGIAIEISAMPWIKPRYLWEDTDRHGNVRRYVKKAGGRKIRIRPDPSTDLEGFWAAYALALEGRGVTADPTAAPGLEPAAEGTLRWLVERWKASSDFAELGPQTRTMRRQLLEACLEEPIEPGSPLLMARIPIGRIAPAHVRMLRDRKRDTPEGANNRLKALRVLFKWAVEQDDIVRRHALGGNPARDVPKFKARNPDGFHTWSLEEVERYEARHPKGSMARLALALFLYTGQRRSDVVQFGRQHIRPRRDGRTGTTRHVLVFTQHKNRARKPVTLELPVLDILQRAIDEGPCGHLTFLVTAAGKPFSNAGFGNRMRSWCDQAGLPQCSAHGLRKAGACIAAENGMTDAQMRAIFGWNDPQMAARYRRKASQSRIANANMHLILSDRGRGAAAAMPLLDWQPTATDDTD